jgi:hypothetical protein
MYVINWQIEMQLNGMCLLNPKASAKVMDNVETTGECYNPKTKPKCNYISLSFIR